MLLLLDEGQDVVALECVVEEEASFLCPLDAKACSMCTVVAVVGEGFGLDIATGEVLGIENPYGADLVLDAEVAQKDVESLGGLAVVLGNGGGVDGVLALEDGVDIADLGLHLGDGGGEGNDFGVLGFYLRILLLYLPLLLLYSLLLLGGKHESFGKGLGNRIGVFLFLFLQIFKTVDYLLSECCVITACED